MYDMGNIFHIEKSHLVATDKAIISGKKYRFTVLTERLIRLEYSPSGTFNDLATELVVNRVFDVPSFNVREDDNFLEVTTSYFKLEYTKEAFFKGKFNSGKVLRVTNNKGEIWYYNHPEAKNFYGSSYELGPIKEGALNRGLYSYDGFVSFDDSNTYRINENGSICDFISGNVDIYLFVYDKDFGLAMKDYFNLTGKPSFIPRYALGNWWCKNEVYDYDKIVSLINDFKDHEIPLSNILLDDSWHLNEYDGKKYSSGYTFNNQLFPNPSFLVKTLHDRGIRLGLKISPEEGILPYEKFYDTAKGYLGVDSKIIPFNPSNPRFLDVYFKTFINPLENLGVDYFFYDYDGDKGSRWLINHYGYLNSERDLSKRGMILSRNGMEAAHRYSILYSGKVKTSWDSLRFMPFYNLSSTNIGVCWWSHDVAGYNGGVEDAELYTRSVELATFSPILRFSSDKSKYYKRAPWAWDKKTYEITKDYLRLRHKLIPYLYTEAYKYYHDGNMVFQPLYYIVPKIYDDINYRNEYFFGSELLVSPITNRKEAIMNRSIHRFYLPDGIWYDFFTGKKYIGNRKYVSFYKDEDYPVFAKKGSIVVMSGDLDLSYNNPSCFEVHVFPGCSNKYRIYEDDGVTQAYKKEQGFVTEFDYNYLKNNYTFIIHPILGSGKNVPQMRSYKVVFRNTKFANDVIVREVDKVIESNNYTLGSDFIVEVNNVSIKNQITINCQGDDIEIDAVRLINDDIDQILQDLQIETEIKELISSIMFSDKKIKDKRIAIRKLKREGLDSSFVKLFVNLLEYIDQI